MAALSGRAIPTAVRRLVIARDGMVCHWCTRPVVRRPRGEPYAPDTLHLDHVTPWASGGDHTPENLVVACAACNLSRPKPREIVRQVKVRVEQRNGTYYWPEGYTPPDVLPEGRRPTRHSVSGFAQRFSLTDAQVIGMATRGLVPASAGLGPIAIGEPDDLMVRPVVGSVRRREPVTTINTRRGVRR